MLLGLGCLCSPRVNAQNAGDSERFLLGETGIVPGWFVTARSNQDALRGGVMPTGESFSTPIVGHAQTSTLWVDKDGWLGLEPLFKPSMTGTNSIAAAAKLNLAAPLQGWLLLRVPGTLLVSVDGKPRLHREISHAHARGWQAIPLALAAGTHTIDVTSRFRREPWAISARVIDASGHAPAGAQWWVPSRGVTTKRNPLPFEVTLELVNTAPAGLGLAIAASAGTRVTKTAPVTISIGSKNTGSPKTIHAGQWPSDEPVSPRRFYLGTVGELLQSIETDGFWSVDVGIGAQHVVRSVFLSKAALLAWKRSVEVLTKSTAGQGELLDVSRVSLQSAQHDLSQAITETQGATEVGRLAERVSYLSAALADDTPAWRQPGIHQLAARSTSDSSIQKFALHVPSGAGDGRARPLVVVLHGYNGTGKRALEAFLDTNPGASAPKVEGYVLAPDAHGNAFYRGPGERDVLEILDWAVQALAVDKTRVSITGASMGGTGSAEIAFHYPDRFAAVSPLCGYQSYFVRRDTALQPLRQWERRLMHRFSPASSAEAGRYLPMYLAQGLKDKPLENSRVLTARYKQLGYSLVEDWPDLGHAVWKRTWAHASMFSWLSQKQWVDDPKRITLSVTTLRHGHSHWLSLTELDDRAELAQLDAEWKSSNQLVVSTQGVSGIEIGPTARMGLDQDLHVQIDGDQLSVAARTPIRLHRAAGHWEQGAPAVTPLRKSVHVEGPWADLWNEKLVFVYGALNAATTGTNRLVAEALASPVSGVDYQYPVLSDQEYINAQRRDWVPIMVGTTADHRLLAKWNRKLPIVVDNSAVVLGQQRYEADGVGALFVYPNPENPTTLVGVVTAPTPEGLWQSTLLPVLLPDFAIFDTRVSPAAGMPILGRAGRMLAAGFFNADWSLPERINDPLDEN